jgi:coproporphyrinogen III oxidase-like Fe-S oxidoreductase
LARWATVLEAGRRPEAESDPESPDSIATEVMMLGLRLADGIHGEDYSEKVWRMVEARYGRAFERALASGRLEATPRGLRIPASLRFVADDAIAWIEAEADRETRVGSRFDRRAEDFITSITCPNLHSLGA